MVVLCAETNGHVIAQILLRADVAEAGEGLALTQIQHASVIGRETESPCAWQPLRLSDRCEKNGVPSWTSNFGFKWGPVE